MTKKKWFGILLPLFLACSLALTGMEMSAFANAPEPETGEPAETGTAQDPAAEAQDPAQPAPEEQGPEEPAAQTDQTPQAQPEPAPAEPEPTADQEAAPAPLTEENRTRGSPAARAAAPVDVQASVTELSIQNLSGQDVNRIYFSDKFYLAMNWDASARGADLHEGDYFDIALPDKMVFPPDTTAADFNIYGEDGTTVIATAHVNPGPDSKGGSVRVTFTSWVEGRENVRGRIRLAAQFDREQITIGSGNTFQISVNGKVTDITAEITGPQELNDEVLAKWGYSGKDKNQAGWNVRINHRKATLSQVVISDHLSEGTGSEIYIPDSFRLWRVSFDSKGYTTQVHEEIPLAGRLTVAPDGKSFSLNLGDVAGDQYTLTYATTYTPGTTLRNNVSLTSPQQSETRNAFHVLADSGGSGTGSTAGRIRLVKTDAEDSAIALSGAVFEVTRPDGTVFELTTGQDGTVTSGPLAAGTYKVKEKTAPAGYVLNDEEYTLEVSASGMAVQTVQNAREKTAVSVTKKWIGKTGSAVRVRLLRDGADTGKALTLDPSSNWTGTFTDLDQYAPDGEPYAYTIREEVVDGYEPRVSGSMEEGFVLTNIDRETRTIPVTKQWVGPAAQAITVRLLADGTDTGQSLVLDAAGQWQGRFTDLPRFDEADGHEISYAVEETPVEGYDAVISGTMDTGFVITNTITGKTSVAVTKKWIGPAQASARVRLFADGKEADAVTLSAENNWQHTFAGLDKYADGKEIQYTIREDAISHYDTRITGDMASGYVITNTNTETTAIPVTKQWVGPAADKAEIELLADGAPRETVTLTADDGWKHTFTGLPKHDPADGHAVVYTIREVPMEGYTAGISGTAATGFVITNTAEGKISVPVTKQWVGPAAASVTVRLYADGKEAAVRKLTAAGGWQYTFKDLERYKDGKEIAYTIQEEAVPGYAMTITGDVSSGFVITNTRKADPGRKADPKKTGRSSSKTPATAGSSRYGLYALLLAASAAILYGLARNKPRQP